MNSGREIERIVKNRRGISALKVILFGPHAWGEPTEDSDIDLLIVKETSDRFITAGLQFESSSLTPSVELR
jgi:predicted nucleotidyltransferase